MREQAIFVIILIALAGSYILGYFKGRVSEWNFKTFTNRELLMLITGIIVGAGAIICAFTMFNLKWNSHLLGY